MSSISTWVKVADEATYIALIIICSAFICRDEKIKNANKSVMTFIVMTFVGAAFFSSRNAKDMHQIFGISMAETIKLCGKAWASLVVGALIYYTGNQNSQK